MQGAPVQRLQRFDRINLIHPNEFQNTDCIISWVLLNGKFPVNFMGSLRAWLVEKMILIIKDNV